MQVEDVKISSFQRGIRAEQCVMRYLEKQGWRIKCHRYKTRYGEIDIIAQDPQDFWVLVEVKARGQIEGGLQSLSKHQLKRIQQAGLMWMCQHPEVTNDFRVDLVVLDSGLRCHEDILYTLKHLKNVGSEMAAECF